MKCWLVLWTGSHLRLGRLGHKWVHLNESMDRVPHHVWSLPSFDPLVQCAAFGCTQDWHVKWCIETLASADTSAFRQLKRCVNWPAAVCMISCCGVLVDEMGNAGGGNRILTLLATKSTDVNSLSFVRHREGLIWRSIQWLSYQWTVHYG